MLQGEQIGFYVWRGHWLKLCRTAEGKPFVRGLRKDQVSRWRSDVARGYVKLTNP